MSNTQILAEQGPMMIQAAEGVFDLANEKLQALEVLLRAFAVVVAVLFIIYRAISTKGAMAAILIAVACGALFIYGVWNVTDLQDRVGTEINSAPDGSSLTVDIAQPAALLGHAA